MRFILKLILCVLPIYGYAQNEHTNEEDIIILIQDNSKMSGASEFGDEYCIFPLTKLKNLRLDSTDANDADFLYNVIKKGGYYVSFDRNGIYTRACCELGDIKQYMLSVDSIKAYNKTNEYYFDFFSKNILKKKLSVSRKYRANNKNSRSYTITMWCGNVSYCVCEAYMEASRAGEFKQIAYVDKLNTVTKPSAKISETMDNYFRRLFVKKSK